MSAGRLDAHHHLWVVARGDYHWMPGDGPLREDYLPSRLEPELRRAGTGGTILVQAAQTVEETRFLLDLAGTTDWVLGVTGWADLERDDAAEQLADLGRDPHLVAVRPMLQDLDDERWITRPTVTDNVRRLAEIGLRYELLSYPKHMPAAYEVLSEVPELPVVIDHLSKPAYRWDDDHDWRIWMRRFAERPNTWCKVSGMVTEVPSGWSAASFEPNVRFVLDSFGPDRVMFGSDWPVCRMAAEYADVVGLAEQLVTALAPDAVERFFRTNAERFYGVTVHTHPEDREASA